MKLDKLEQKILDYFSTTVREDGQSLTDADKARIAAKICLEVAEKAYQQGEDDKDCISKRSFEDFKKEIL